MASILLIEDEAELARVVRSYLEQAGFSVFAAGRGDSGLQLWEQRRPDLVILDLNLPGMDGLDVARSIRHKGSTPIIIMTARVEEADQLVGLELGADDYVTKPFSPRVLVARVRALLRRLESVPAGGNTLRIGDLEIDVDGHRVRQGEHELDLTPTEFALLNTLAGAPGRAFSRLQLLEASSGAAYEGYERSIDAHIKNLRAKIEPDPKKPHYIETVFGVGYRFNRDL